MELSPESKDRLNYHKQRTINMRWFGKPVTEMTVDELLGVIGMQVMLKEKITNDLRDLRANKLRERRSR